MNHKDRDQWIKDRAYSLWEISGRPHGRDHEHWQQALADWETYGRSQNRAGARPPTEAEKAEILARIHRHTGGHIA